jgi:thioredoxin 1
MEPIIEELEKEWEGKVQIKKIDVDQDEETSSKYGVMSIPTYLLLKDGEEVERFIGAQPKESIKSKIESHLV